MVLAYAAYNEWVKMGKPGESGGESKDPLGNMSKGFRVGSGVGWMASVGTVMVGMAWAVL